MPLSFAIILKAVLQVGRPYSVHMLMVAEPTYAPSTIHHPAFMLYCYAPQKSIQHTQPIVGSVGGKLQSVCDNFWQCFYIKYNSNQSADAGAAVIKLCQYEYHSKIGGWFFTHSSFCYIVPYGLLLSQWCIYIYMHPNLASAAEPIIYLHQLHIS